MPETVLYHSVESCKLLNNLSRVCSGPYITCQIHDFGIRGYYSQMVGKKKREGWRESEPFE